MNTADPTLERDWQYVYGPVPSRRLGRSLGVSPIPDKTCNYSCIYCQLGRTTRMIRRRQRFFPPEQVIDELHRALGRHSRGIDHVTFVGEGEPTLSIDLGDFIKEARRGSDVPVALITNGYLLSDREVREGVVGCDVVMPSLDTVVEDTFHRLNRPCGGLTAARLVDGLRRFRDEYNGRLGVEIMLVDGLNDNEEELMALHEALHDISPDEVYVNLPLRPPAEEWVQPPGPDGLVLAMSILGDVVVIEGPEEGCFSTSGSADPMDSVVAITRRHPMRRDQIATALGLKNCPMVEEQLSARVRRGELQPLSYRGHVYFTAGSGRRGRS